MHIRTQIRNYVVSLLDGNTDAGTNVFPSRVYPLTDDTLPGICVYTPSEAIDDEDGKQSHEQKRSQTVVVECRNKIIADLDETLDDLSESVEQLLFADQFLDGLICGLDLLTTETEFSDDAEQPVGLLVMTFTAHALTNEGSPETPI